MEILGIIILFVLIYAYGPVILTFILIFAAIFIIKKIVENREERKLLEEQRLYEEAQSKWYEKQRVISEQRRKMFKEILGELHLKNLNMLIREYDDQIIVKSAQDLKYYSDLVYIGESNALENIRTALVEKREIVDSLNTFLKENGYKAKPQYDYIEKQLIDYTNKPITYKVKVVYKTSDGINRGTRYLNITEAQIELLREITSEIHLENVNLLIKEYDDQIIVKSAQSLNSYSDCKYLRDSDSLNKARAALIEKREIADSLKSLLKENSQKTKPQYDYVEKQLINYANAPIRDTHL